MPETAPARLRVAVFRLEFGGATGWGHLARCAALAAELKRRGWTCVLWSDGALERVPADLRKPFDTVRRAGPTWFNDAPRAGWLVIDHYGVDDATLHRLRGSSQLLVIDDEAKRRLDAADLILNTRLGLAVSPYASGPRTLLGERFALLRPGLLAPSAIEADLPAGVQPVLVMLGGTDPRGLTSVALDALADVDARGFAPVVIGATAQLSRFSASIPLAAIDAPTLAAWARVCRFAISAAGGTLYELALLRLPFVAIVAAENQRAFAAEVARRWRMPVIDGHGAGGPVREKISGAIRALLARPANEHEFDAIDALGASRVADAMEIPGRGEAHPSSGNSDS
jgi:spore coat polysaccharide biosynthesis predicted glycosyltransferase SpsG